jgi:hypothetical protein
MKDKYEIALEFMKVLLPTIYKSEGSEKGLDKDAYDLSITCHILAEGFLKGYEEELELDGNEISE